MSSNSVRLDERGAPVLEEGEEILFSLPRVRLVRERDEGAGKAAVTSRRVIWVANEAVEVGIAWSFHDIALHAISRSVETFKQPCLYCQLVIRDENEENAEGENGENAVKDFRLVPDTDDVLEQLYEAMNKGAALNPDPLSDDDEMMGAGLDIDVDVNMDGPNEPGFEDDEDGE